MTKTRKSFQAPLMAGVFSLFAVTAQAAGLGAIQVHSGIGQPLRAEIPVQADARELESLSASVAPPEAFREAGVDYTALMGRLQLSIDRDGAQPVVRVSSQRPVNEPFVEMLVELSWATGSVRRNFTFLLDPVDRPARSAVATPRADPADQDRVSPRAASEQRSTYTVQGGDTLHRVARQHQPQGVNVDQVVVALFRDNPDAFAGGNMNRLQAGAIMSIPDAERVRSISAADARREIVAHSEDFEAYRSRLAAAATREPRRQEASTQSQSGRISPQLEASAREDAGGGDRVEVSSGQRDEEDGTSAARLDALEEELASRERALQETHERLAALESSIRDLQQLLELRNRTLAQLQAQLEEHGEIVALPLELADVVGAETVDVPLAAPGPGEDQAGTPVETRSDPMQQLLQDRTTWIGLGGIAALLLGYALYRINARRRREDQASFEDYSANAQVEPHVTTSVTPAATSVAAADDAIDRAGDGAIDTEEGVDAVAEADVYMAYGRDAQAEEILRDALATDPENLGAQLKLLEVYAHQNNAAQFSTLAAQVHSRIGGDGSEWAQVAAMGRELDPDNPLYGGTERPTAGGRGGASSGYGGAAAGAVAGAAATHSASDAEPQPDSGEGDDQIEHVGQQASQGAPATEPLDDLEFTLADDTFSADAGDAQDAPDEVAERLPDDMTPAGESGDDSADETSAEKGEDFNLPDLNFDFSWDPSATDHEATDAERSSEKAAGDRWLEDTVVGDELRFEPDRDEKAFSEDDDASSAEKTAAPDDKNLLDFDLDLPDDAAFTTDDAVEGAGAPDFDFSDIDLDLNSPPSGEASGQAGEVAGDAETQSDDAFVEEVETKLELARAYEEMGDKEGARELINEVLDEGNDAQRGQAREVLERLG